MSRCCCPFALGLPLTLKDLGDLKDLKDRSFRFFQLQTQADTGNCSVSRLLYIGGNLYTPTCLSSLTLLTSVHWGKPLHVFYSTFEIVVVGARMGLTMGYHGPSADLLYPLGPLGFDFAQHRQTLRPTLDGTRSKALHPFGSQ